jgi:hypothetical protein
MAKFSMDAAIFENKLARAVIDTAISCEVAVKQTFFGESTIARAAYEYLEDRGQGA